MELRFDSTISGQPAPLVYGYVGKVRQYQVPVTGPVPGPPVTVYEVHDGLGVEPDSTPGSALCTLSKAGQTIGWTTASWAVTPTSPPTTGGGQAPPPAGP